MNSSGILLDKNRALAEISPERHAHGQLNGGGIAHYFSSTPFFKYKDVHSMDYQSYGDLHEYQQLCSV